MDLEEGGGIEPPNIQAAGRTYCLSVTGVTPPVGVDTVRPIHLVAYPLQEPRRSGARNKQMKHMKK